MRMDADDFLAWKNRAITLLGMSGAGKTTLASKLPKTSWFHFSGDYRIGTRYLEEPIVDNVKREAMQVELLRNLLCSDSISIISNITVHNLAPISTFLGKVGDPARGGLSVEEFKRRQHLHRDAEIRAMRDVETFIEKGREIYGYPHFVNDAGGSVCELIDTDAIEVLAANTLVLYLRAGPDMEQALIERQRAHPKPLYYGESFLDERLQEYVDDHRLGSTDDMNPDKFVQWIFPKLVEYRRPLYQRIADEHGYTLQANDAEHIRDEADLLELIAAAIRAAS